MIIFKTDEELIRWGWPEDVWFHVDKLSSAHVYLRLPEGQTIDDISPELLEDCCQLVKANSIQGCKLNNVDIVYTMWSNLKKTKDMEAGQVAFHSEKAVKKYKVEKKNNEIINRLNKTKIIRENVDLRSEREDRDKKERDAKKLLEKERQKLEKEQEKARQELARLKSYDSVFSKQDLMKTNKVCIQYV